MRVSTIIVGIVLGLAISAGYAFGQQLPTTGEPLGRGHIVAGQSTETGGGTGVNVFSGLGVAKDVDAYLAIGGDAGGGWMGLGFNATSLRTQNFSFSLSGLVRVGSSFGITPRFTLTQKISPRVNAFGGASYVIGHGKNWREQEGWKAVLGARFKVDEKLSVISEMLMGHGPSARIGIVYRAK